MPGGKIALPPNRLLKKSIRGLFQHAKQKAWFLLCFIFQTLSVFEKWRYVPIPHRRVMKNLFFITLLAFLLIGLKDGEFWWKLTQRVRGVLKAPGADEMFAPIGIRQAIGPDVLAGSGGVDKSLISKINSDVRKSFSLQIKKQKIAFF